ncbi:MAG: PIN domain-containing protein [Isosphaeraceae bacterium]
MNPALIDTDILSEFTKGINATVAAHAVAYRQLFGRYSVSAVTYMEAVRGYRQKQATRQLHAFLAAFASEEVLPIDREIADLAGQIAGELERIGQPIGTADPMIAATALHHGLDQVTGNTAHFERIR